MNEKKRVFTLIAIMAAVVVSVFCIASYLLYRTAFKEQEERLMETVRSQARLMEAMARFVTAHVPDYPGGSMKAALSQVIDGHGRYKGFGKTGEFTLARREGNNIVFLLHHRHYDLDELESVSFDSNRAEPMRQAFSGKSGTMVGMDYRGRPVVAAYSPVWALNLGIVAKIDLAEIRAPFLKTGAIVLGLSLLMILGGTGLFIGVTNPMIRKLQESEERYRNLYNYAPNAYFSISAADGSILSCNAAAEKLLGYDRSSFVRMKAIDLYANTPFGKQKAQAVFERFRSGETLDNSELQMKHKDGRLVWINLSVYPIRDLDGNVIESRSIATDISRLKEIQETLEKSEGRLKLIIEKNADAILVISRDGIVRFANPAAELLLGRTALELMGTDIGFPVIGEEIPYIDILHPSGAQIFVAMRAVEIMWEGEPSFLTSLRDITEIKKAKERVQNLNNVILASRNVNQLIIKEKNRDRLIQGATSLTRPDAQPYRDFRRSISSPVLWKWYRTRSTVNETPSLLNASSTGERWHDLSLFRSTMGKIRASDPMRRSSRTERKWNSRSRLAE